MSKNLGLIAWKMPPGNPFGEGEHFLKRGTGTYTREITEAQVMDMDSPLSRNTYARKKSAWNRNGAEHFGWVPVEISRK